MLLENKKLQKHNHKKVSLRQLKNMNIDNFMTVTHYGTSVRVISI